MPDVIEELDLIGWEIGEDKYEGMQRNHIEGKHQIPYKTKEIWLISDVASWKSQSNSDDPNNKQTIEKDRNSSKNIIH